MDIREYWGPKKENIIISVEKIYSFLKQLEPIDDVFKLWFLPFIYCIFYYMIVSFC